MVDRIILPNQTIDYIAIEDIVNDDMKLWIAIQVLHIGKATCTEVIQSSNLMPVLQQQITQV